MQFYIVFYNLDIKYYRKKEADMNKVKENLIDFSKDKLEWPNPEIIIKDEKTKEKKDTLLGRKNNSK